MRDDGGTVDGSRNAVSQLVVRDRVFAVVPTVTTDLGAADVLVSQRVPYVGWALSSNFCGNRYGFAVTGCQLPRDGKATSNVWPLLVRQVLGAGTDRRSAVVVTERGESGTYALAAVEAAVASVGLTLAKTGARLPVPPAGDYDAVVRALLTAHDGADPDVVFVAASYSNIVLLDRALRNAGLQVGRPVREGPAARSCRATASPSRWSSRTPAVPSSPSRRHRNREKRRLRRCRGASASGTPVSRD